jgi:hypothetical protein
MGSPLSAIASAALVRGVGETRSQNEILPLRVAPGERERKITLLGALVSRTGQHYIVLRCRVSVYAENPSVRTLPDPRVSANSSTTANLCGNHSFTAYRTGRAQSAEVRISPPDHVRMFLYRSERASARGTCVIEPIARTASAVPPPRWHPEPEPRHTIPIGHRL